ncbi:radical SAM protein [Candidatus Woesearchaeota archaeon]|nr:radical SAM protein [Candidatus Woesearchaeota archaeon]
MKYEGVLDWSIHSACNFECEYCIAGKNHKTKGPILPVDIHKFTDSLNKINKTIKVIISGGEPLIIPNIVEVCKEITKKHYLVLITNLSVEKIIRFFDEIDPSRVVIVSSAHFFELEKRNLMDKFISYHKYGRKKGFNLACNIVAYPGYLDKFDYYLDLFDKNSIGYSIVPFFGEYNGKKYPKEYSNEELKKFRLKNVKEFYSSRNEICPAGSKVLVCDCEGNIYRCFNFMVSKGYKLSNIEEKIEFTKNWTICPFKKCKCPFYQYEKDNFKFDKNTDGLDKFNLMWLQQILPENIVNIVKKRTTKALKRTVKFIRKAPRKIIKKLIIKPLRAVKRFVFEKLNLK